VSRIGPNPRQPRAHIDEQALAELAASIREHGIIQPLIVTELPEQPGHYWLVAGERRWRAAQLAQWEEVPIIVREASPQQLLEWALVENVQRADLDPLEEAAAYHNLMQEFNLTQVQVAERVGKSRSAVANSVRLLQLSPAVQAALGSGQISAGHARALLALPDGPSRESALAIALKRGLNVRQLEALVKRMQAQPKPAPIEQEKPDGTTPAMRAHLRFLEERFRSAFGTKVTLERRSNGSGRLVVHFFSDEDLEQLYQQIIGDKSTL
jgi:ParB family transcriptional regulator, chromosome partitioning protein